MRLTDFFGVSHGMRRKRDDRLRIAGAKWRGPCDHGEETTIRCCRTYRSID
jgi:hypothetical protein